MSSFARILELKRQHARLEDVGECDDAAVAKLDVAHVLDDRVAGLGAVDFGGKGWGVDVALCEGGLFDVDAAAEGDAGGGCVGRIADVGGGGADAFVSLPLDVPVFAFEARVVRAKVDFSDVQDELESDVPEFLLQVYEQPVTIGAPRVDKVADGSLLRWTKVADVLHDHGFVA